MSIHITDDEYGFMRRMLNGPVYLNGNAPELELMTELVRRGLIDWQWSGGGGPAIYYLTRAARVALANSSRVPSEASQ